jgi:HK97 family phage prohead protease
VVSGVRGPFLDDYRRRPSLGGPAAALSACAPRGELRPNLELALYRLRQVEADEHRLLVAIATPSMRIQGLAAPFFELSEELRDRNGDYVEWIMPGAFRACLAQASAGEHVIEALWNHERRPVLASTLDGSLQLEERAGGLWFDLRTGGLTADQANAVRLGQVQVSIGGLIRDDNWHRSGNPSRRVVNDWRLTEISLLPAGAYRQTFAREL